MRATLVLPTGPKFDVCALMVPDLHAYLLAIKGVIRSQGPVVLTNNGAYLLPELLIKIIDLKQKIEKLNKGMYVSRGTITVSAVAISAENLPYSNLRRSETEISTHPSIALKDAPKHQQWYQWKNVRHQYKGIR